jgi:drug/metabolite transporter (DMT)-like permease
MSARAWAGFFAMSTIWGVPYLFIKVAVDDGVPPAFLAWSRVVLAAAVLLALAWRAGTLPSLRGRGRWLVGLLIGLAGVVALVGIDIAGQTDELLGAAAILVAAAGYAAGPMVLNRKLADIDPRATMGASLAIAGVVLTPFAAARPPAAVPSGAAIAALLVLGLVCTAAAFVIYSRLIAEIGPGRALVITYVAPVVAVALGVSVLGERPGAGAIAGLLLIIAGSWLSTDGRLPPRLLTLARSARRSPQVRGY